MYENIKILLFTLVCSPAIQCISVVALCNCKPLIFMKTAKFTFSIYKYEDFETVFVKTVSVTRVRMTTAKDFVYKSFQSRNYFIELLSIN